MMSKMSETNFGCYPSSLWSLLQQRSHSCDYLLKQYPHGFIVYVSSIEGDLRTLVLEVYPELFCMIIILSSSFVCLGV